MDMLNDDSGAFPVRREANSQAALGQSRSIVAPAAVTAYRVVDEFNATAVNGRIWSILLKKSGSPADDSGSRICCRGETPEIISRRIISKAARSPRRWRLEKLLENRRRDFFNTIGQLRPVDQFIISFA